MTSTTWPLAAALALACAAPAFAAPQPIGYTAPDGVNAVAVTPSSPLPMVSQGGSVTPTPASSNAVAAAATTAVGTSAVTVDGAQTRRSYLLVHNAAPLGGATISCAFTSAPTVNGPGTLSLYPGQYLTWESSAVPNAALTCIASAAATPFAALLLDQ